jgi:hypothetical protein
MKKPIVLLVGVAGAVIATVRRRRARADADALWREATSESSR